MSAGSFQDLISTATVSGSAWIGRSLTIAVLIGRPRRCYGWQFRRPGPQTRHSPAVPLGIPNVGSADPTYKLKKIKNFRKLSLLGGVIRANACPRRSEGIIPDQAWEGNGHVQRYNKGMR